MDDMQPAARHASSSETCQYSLYFPASSLQVTGPASSSMSFEQAGLQALCAKVLQFVEDICQANSYIWQRDSFSLQAVSPLAPSSSSQPASSWLKLQGATRYGESVEDEWWIVYLLFQISKQWPEAAIEIHDDDGQFLLIEAADDLPQWLTPGNAENRLWIRNGSLHLVPISVTSPAPPSLENTDIDPNGYVNIDQALELVARSDMQTLAPPAVTRAITSRISGFPESLPTDHDHTTIAYLPSQIADILEVSPSLVSRAVGAFYERDALQLRAAQFMKRFPPDGKCRKSSVRMTRSLYAQLIAQRFYPPKPFIKAGWTEGLAESSPEARHRDIGMKISCGFEMLYAESSNIKQGTQEDLGDASRTPNQAYLKYLVALSSAGYFQGETPGSKLYTELEGRARGYWDQMASERGNRVENFKVLCEHALEIKQADNTPKPSADLYEDSDEWLYLDQQKLDDLLEKSTSKPEHAPLSTVSDLPSGQQGEDEDEDERLANREARKLQDIASKFESFLDGEGDLEGAMLEDEHSDDQDSDGDGDDLDEDLVAGPASSLSAAQRRQARMDQLVPKLRDNEWGEAAAAASKALNASVSQSKGDQTQQERDAERVKSKFEVEKYDGASDSSGSENGDIRGYEDDAEPQVEGDPELKFGVEDMEDFLRFTREALGLSEEQYKDIVEKRKNRSAVDPGRAAVEFDSADNPMLANDTMNIDSKANTPSASGSGLRNPNLDNFESLMNAMDAELSKARASQTPAKASFKAPPRKSAEGIEIYDDVDDDETDSEEVSGTHEDLSALDAEISQLLKEGNTGDASGDYTMIKNFLESFKAQGGLAGPVSNMFGRLDPNFAMPRDEN